MRKRVSFILLLAIVAVTIALALSACVPEVDMSGVKFESKTVVFDGTEHELTVSGELPEGVTVTYENNKITNVGSVEAIAHFTHENDKVVIPDMKATLTVTAAKGSADAVIFEDKTVSYDGTEHELVISGALPEGVSVSYTANKLTKPGTLEVTASFTSTDPNYTYDPMTATLTVTKAKVDTADIALQTTEFTYDGTEHSVELKPLPEYIKYTLINNKGIKADNYTCLVQFDEETVDAKPVTLQWKINKADMGEDMLEGITFTDKSFTYDGTEHKLALTGAEKLPEGFTIAYSANNSLTKPGSVQVTATIRNANYNDKTFTATLAVTKAVIDMSAVSIENTNVVYDGTAKFVNAANLPQNVEASYVGNGQTNVGSYSVEITYTLKEDADCYSLSKSTDSATLVITPKTVVITTIEELQAINDTVAASANYRYELGNNIDGSQAVDKENLVDGKYRWTGIGSLTHPFASSLDGKNYTISNLYIDVNSGVFEAGQYFIGIFNVTASSQADDLWIQNVTISSVKMDIDADTIVTTGILAGRNGHGNTNVTGIRNVTISDSIMDITAPRVHAGYAVGYLLGNNKAKYQNIKCTNIDMTATELSTRAQIGGIAGYLEANSHIYENCVIDSQCTMNITVTGDNVPVQIGGFAGYYANVDTGDIQIYSSSSAAQISLTVPETYSNANLHAGKILGKSDKDGGDVVGATYILIDFDSSTMSSDMTKFNWTGSFKVNGTEKEDLAYYTAANGVFSTTNA